MGFFNSKSLNTLKKKMYLPINISDGPEVSQHSFSEQVPDLRPHPRGLIYGGRQKLLGFFIRVQLDELLDQLGTQTILVHTVPLQQDTHLNTFKL